MYNKRKIGSTQEEKAEQFLKEQNYYIIERNFYCRSGEIDIIAKDGEYLVFIEVKYRSSADKGTPEEAVHARKIRSIVHTARFYMLRHGIPEDTPCRFDVVVIFQEEIRIIKDAFEVRE